MDKKTQDHSWACLPKEAREEIRTKYKKCVKAVESTPRNYIGDTKHRYLKDSLEYFFGHHNLTSDTEPKEMLMVERKKVQEVYKTSNEILNNESYGSKMYSMHLQIMCVLEILFGDKCLPDKESGQSNLCDTCSNELKDSSDCIYFASCGIKSCSDFKSKEEPQPKFKYDI